MFLTRSVRSFRDPDPEALLRTVLSDFEVEILETSPVEYKCRKKEDLPQTALDYIAYLEKAVSCPIKYVSVGAERDAYIEMF